MEGHQTQTRFIPRKSSLEGVKTQKIRIAVKDMV